VEGKVAAREALCPESSLLGAVAPSSQGNVSGLWQRWPFAGRPERVQAPNILRFIMPQDKEITVIGPHPEIDCAGGVPLILNLCDFEFVPPQDKSDGALVGSISGIALDAHFAHRCLP
jgi:hypothetical protein